MIAGELRYCLILTTSNQFDFDIRLAIKPSGDLRRLWMTERDLEISGHDTVAKFAIVLPRVNA